MDDNLLGYIPKETMLVPTNPTTYLLPTQNFSSTLSPPRIKDCHLTASRFHSYGLTQSAIMVFKSWDEVQIGNKKLEAAESATAGFSCRELHIPSLPSVDLLSWY
jgi:hypothetical protein